MRSLWLLLVLAMSVATAKVELLEFQSAEAELRYKSLIAELRCLVCQNQNLADSNADLAADLRKITYDMIREGATDAEIVSFMVDRYGDFVLYRPPLKASTVLLWVGPFVLLAAGLVAAIAVMRRRRVAPVADPAALATARRLLDD